MRKRQKNFQQWAPNAKVNDTKESLTERPDVNLGGGDHFASRKRANEFIAFLRSLPDIDPILRKMGKGIPALRELMTDSHMESVWGVRCSATSGGEWFCAAGAEGKREQEASDAFTEQLKRLDIPRIIEEMMDAVAYGFSPLEILWVPDNGRWGIGNIVGKPPEWFQFDQDNRLVFKTGMNGTEDLPDNRFLVVQHRPSYANPYGDKVFSKCYWAVTFKKNGFRWWTVFVEKYGGAFMYGKYPSNAGKEFKDELLGALEKMISDAVAIAPEGSEITIESVANKGTISSVHKDYIEAANAEISKAVLGQTLTTEIGEKGSYAAANTHNMVREDLAAADRRRICAAFDRLASVFTLYNFGPDVAPPKFQFVQDEDLQKERAERDTKLYAIGWRPKKTYIAREYGIPEEDFDLTDAAPQGFSRKEPVRHFAHGACRCGCEDKKQETLFRKFAALFASKADKQSAKDNRLMQEFSDLVIRSGQEELDAQIESYVDALGKVDNYEDASAALMSAYDSRALEGAAHLVDEIRFAAQGIGGSHE